MPKFDHHNPDLFRFVTPDLQRLLVFDYDQLHEFCERTCGQLDLDQKEMEERLDELRTFLLLAIIAARSNLLLPGQWLAEPPPKLLAIWKALYDDMEIEPQMEYHRFGAALGIPMRDFGYRPSYSPEHQFSHFKKGVLTSLAGMIGISVRKNLWE